MKKIIFLLIFLMGCQGLNIVQTPSVQKSPDVYVGTSALETVFNDASSKNLLMCDQGNVLITVKNNGAFNIVDGSYTYILDQFIKPISQVSGKFSLEGKSAYNPNGEYNLLRFQFQSSDMPSQLESYNANVVFQACYPYQTFATAVVCIDPDIQNLNPNKPCRSQIIPLSGGQGAPVEVVSVEPVMSVYKEGIKPVFKILIRHSGIGQVVQLDSVNVACSDKITSSSNKIEFGSFVDINVKLQGADLTCNPSPLRLDYSKDTLVICKTDKIFDLSKGIFTTPLSIELKYGYVNTAVLPVTITRYKGQNKCS